MTPPRSSARLALLLALGLFLVPFVRADAQVAFTIAAQPPLRGPSFGIVTADFNGDSRPDFAATNNYQLVVYLGDGAGGFAKARFYDGGGYFQSLTAADLNGDGRPDIIAVHYTTISVLLNDGEGHFSAPINVSIGGENAKAAATGDFDRDGKIDVAVTIFDADEVAILLGNGQGGFTSTTSFPAGDSPTQLAVADFEGDGFLDLAISTYNSEEVLTLRGNGSGGFSAGQSYPLGGNGGQIVAGDFNHDQIPDLAVGVYNIPTANHMSVFLGAGDGTFAESAEIPAPDPTALTAADLNGDGNLDLVCTNYVNPILIVALGDGTGHFPRQDRVRLPGRAYPYAIANADFNLDGLPDLAIGNTQSNRATILLNLSHQRCHTLNGVRCSRGRCPRRDGAPPRNLHGWEFVTGGQHPWLQLHLAAL